jgi:hypothetical protein
MQLARQIQLYIFFITCCLAATSAAVWRACSCRITAPAPASGTLSAAVIAAAWAARIAVVITFLQAAFLQAAFLQAAFLQAASWLTRLASLLLLLLPPAR